jgi:hypothetical protein
MTDIVERLFKFSLARSGELLPNPDAALADEARHEIERLRDTLIEINEVMVRAAIEKSPPAPCHRKD